LGILSFSRYQWVAIIAVGIITPLVDSRVEVFLPNFFYQIRGVVSIFTFTGGPVNGDLLVAWEEYGGVVAAYLVRKPGAATIAMAINGFGQFFLVDGFAGPHHLVYGVTGLGADVAFAMFRYKRYDVLVCTLAGLMSQLFWIPVTYTYHAVIGHYSISFIEGDLVARIFGGAVGDGLMGLAIGFAVLTIAKTISETRRGRGSPSGTRTNVSMSGPPVRGRN
jgi:energy-coupling factor transport system substrate-specific component